MPDPDTIPAVGRSCVGRWIAGSRKAFGENGPGPCNYAGFGLFRLNPVEVDTETCFAFAGGGAS